MKRYEFNKTGSDIEREHRPAPRVVVIGLASCFGCQLQITNMERYLTDVVGQIDLTYWQLASSDPMPEDFDVAIIEGAITTRESLELVQRLRERAKAVMTIGSCANTAGIPGIAVKDYENRPGEVYGNVLPTACGDVIEPRSVPSVIDVEYQVNCCPIDFYDFVAMLQRALYGSNRTRPNRTMCGDCKCNETTCFYERGELCLGLVTAAGCGARCPNLGRPCFGCAGLSKDANLESARESVLRHGLDPCEFDDRLELFSQTNEIRLAHASEGKAQDE